MFQPPQLTHDDISHLQVKQAQTTNSKGQTLLTAYTYPHNYTTAPYTTMATSVMSHIN
jgi:hypothetical protein